MAHRAPIDALRRAGDRTTVPRGELSCRDGSDGAPVPARSRHRHPPDRPLSARLYSMDPGGASLPGGRPGTVFGGIVALTRPRSQAWERGYSFAPLLPDWEKGKAEPRVG